MRDRAERFHGHLDRIEAHLDLIGGFFAGNAAYDKWPMPRDEYVHVAERLERAAGIARQHIEAYDKGDRDTADAESRLDAWLGRAA